MAKRQRQPERVLLIEIKTPDIYAAPDSIELRGIIWDVVDEGDFRIVADTVVNATKKDLRRAEEHPDTMSPTPCADAVAHLGANPHIETLEAAVLKECGDVLWPLTGTGDEQDALPTDPAELAALAEEFAPTLFSVAITDHNNIISSYAGLVAIKRHKSVTILEWEKGYTYRIPTKSIKHVEFIR
jgi:hypothetical protein